MKLTLSKRLTTISNHVYPYRYIIDIGTDHSLVPIFLVLNNMIDRAVAGDISAQAVDNVKALINDYGLTEKISARLGNGLSVIDEDDRCDCLIIAGIGGGLITRVLESGKSILSRNKRLILQANVNEKKVRHWLQENAYEITAEEIIQENNVFYEIIVADKKDSCTSYSDKELKYGPVLYKDKNELFREKWEEILKRKKRIYKKIPENSSKKLLFAREIKEIENMLK